MTDILTRLRKKFSQGSLLLVLQGSVLVLGPLATPKCAYGPPDNGWDDWKSDMPFYDGRGQDQSQGDVAVPTDQVAEDLGTLDALDVPPTQKYGPLYCDGCGDNTTLPDAVSDVQPDTSDAAAGWYGTLPPDVVDVQDSDAISDIKPETNCEPMDMYGPPPCTDDTECAQYGQDYYCDKTHVVNDSCGNPMEWPVCEKK